MSNDLIPFSRIWSPIRTAFAPPSLRRLENTIPIFAADLDALEKMSSAQGEASGSFEWAKLAKALLLEEVEKSVVAGDAERGWRCLKAADRFTWHGLGTVAPVLLEAKVEAIATEAEDEKKGLTKWRRESIRKLLRNEDGKIIPVNSQNVHRVCPEIN